MESGGVYRRTYTLRGKEAREIDNSRLSFGHRTKKQQSIGLLDLPFEVIEIIVANLQPVDISNLSITSKIFHHLIFPPKDQRPSVRAWRNVSLTPTNHYANNTRILNNPFILQNIRTLILDGCPSISVDWLMSNLLNAESKIGKAHRIQLLSWRDLPFKVKVNEFPVRLYEGREKLPPTLQGMYLFSDTTVKGTEVPGAHVFVSGRCERTLRADRKRRDIMERWEGVLDSLKDRLVFDTEVCRGKRHHINDSPLDGAAAKAPQVATIRLTSTCAGCGACPSVEDWCTDSPILFPPVPIHSWGIAAATSSKHMKTAQGLTRPTLRCGECMDDCYCRGCKKWWCNSCSIIPPTAMAELATEENAAETSALVPVSIVSLDCYECGKLCADCRGPTSKKCQLCSGLYCVEHNEGSNEVHCEWCVSAARSGRSRANTIPTQSNVANPTKRITEVDLVLQNAAVLSDPANTASASSRSPHLYAAPQPIVTLSSLRSPITSGWGAQKAKMANNPNVKAPLPAVPAAAGMRFRTMMAGGSSVGGTAGSGSGGTGAGKVLAGRAGGLVR
ncbi:hypothetical protein DFH27DRAFT_315344 [Peziza echinospora]|nr:hypothetical protein DFH27DRAFT_315344 [Peziza echinospora]